MYPHVHTHTHFVILLAPEDRCVVMSCSQRGFPEIQDSPMKPDVLMLEQRQRVKVGEREGGKMYIPLQQRPVKEGIPLQCIQIEIHCIGQI